MDIDLNKLREQVQAEEEENSRDNNLGYPLVYPGENGKLTLKLLFNIKSGLVQRKVTRHDTGKGKIACLAQYGQDCPVCKAISEVETNRGKEIGAFRKYGYKTRGICFAQIIDFDKQYFTDDKSPKKGDIIILLYPRTVYDLINKIIIDAINNGINIVSKNSGIPVVIERTQKGNAFPKYNAYLSPYGEKKSFDNTEDKTGDEIFDELLESLPDLSETIIPKYPTDELYRATSSLSDIILKEYELGTGVINPNDNLPAAGTAKDNKNSDTATTNFVDSGIESTVSISTDNPECFGHHEPGSKKCMLCPAEGDCFAIANN